MFVIKWLQKLFDLIQKIFGLNSVCISHPSLPKEPVSKIPRELETIPIYNKPVMLDPVTGMPMILPKTPISSVDDKRTHYHLTKGLGSEWRVDVFWDKKYTVKHFGYKGTKGIRGRVDSHWDVNKDSFVVSFQVPVGYVVDVTIEYDDDKVEIIKISL